MRITDLMKKSHGSAITALHDFIKKGMTAQEIAAHYNCDRSTITKLAKREKITLPVTSNEERAAKLKISREKNKVKEDDWELSSSRNQARLTAAMFRTIEESRAVLSAQVVHITPNHPNFMQVAAEILARRSI